MSTEIKVSSVRTLNPSTGLVEKEFEQTTPEQLNQILDKATKAFSSWRSLSVAERCTYLNKAADLVADRKDVLAKLATIEMGKAIGESIREVGFMEHIFRYYAQNSEAFLKDEPVKGLEDQAYVMYDPIGVILSVQPWNFPYYQIVRAAAPNLAAGNTYILKHASNVPQCALAFEQIIKDAGFPEGVYTNIFLSGSKIDQLISDPRIAAVTLTGSEAAGAAVASAAGRNVKKTTLELGGSDPFIVLADINLDKVAQLAVLGRFSNAGQICIASKRVIALKEVAEPLLAKIIELTKDLKVGDPLDPSNQMGPVSSEKGLNDVMDQVGKAVSAGAKIVFGGKKIDGAGFFMEPTILTNIEKGNPAYDEEIFGPVLLFFVAENEEEAIKIANDTRFGLGGSVYSNDIAAAERVARKVESGMVHINKPSALATSIETPFGGTKSSGYGRDHYRDGILEFVNAKLINKTGSLQ